ncbi:hypothetical protein MMC18_007542, partial [Xylographa bjoerkii]|nr:hypothetical protein [Xylographa bjoerkii]
TARISAPLCWVCRPPPSAASPSSLPTRSTRPSSTPTTTPRQPTALLCAPPCDRFCTCCWLPLKPTPLSIQKFLLMILRRWRLNPQTQILMPRPAR